MMGKFTNYIGLAMKTGIDAYIKILSHEIKILEWEIGRELELLEIDNKKSIFKIKDQTISLVEFALLLGKKLYKSPNFYFNVGPIWVEHLPSVKKEFQKANELLLMVPGAILPPVPDELKEWLDRE